MTKLKTIGVLGGMGPEATVSFMQRMIAAVEADDDACHIPLLVDNNTQVPSRIKAIIEATGDDPAPVLADMARRLEIAGAQALVMPCNTAHYFAKAVEDAVAIPFINMLELAAHQASSIVGESGRIGVLGSPALRMSGVFEQVMGVRGLSPIYCSDEDRLLQIIKDIKKRGPTTKAAAQLSIVAEEFAQSGADLVMICCSEFSLLANDIESRIPVLDTLDELVHASIKFSTGNMPTRLIDVSVQSVHRSGTASKNQSSDLQGKETAQC